MGYRGPAPKPTEIRRLEGNMSRRPYNENEPRPRLAIPKCPDHLDEEARKEWRRLSRILLRTRVLTEADGIALANLCQAYSTMTRAQKKLNQSGLMMKTPSGYLQQSPLIGIINSSMHTITALLREFGLTPASRTSIQTVEPEQRLSNAELMCS